MDFRHEWVGGVRAVGAAVSGDAGFGFGTAVSGDGGVVSRSFGAGF